MQVLDLKVDVAEATGLDGAEVAVTVHLPDADLLATTPVVCVGKPGGGYSRGYYTVDLPGPTRGAQAQWHAARGWVFISVDHLGVGDSSTHHDPDELDFTRVAAGNHAAEQEVLTRLAKGAIGSDFPAIADPLFLGIGQSMGGCMTVIQQGRYHCYDGIGVLGYSAVHTTTQLPTGRGLSPWVPRDAKPSAGVMTNAPQVTAGMQDLAAMFAAEPGQPPRLGWGFHYDDVDPEIVKADLDAFPTRNGNVPAWASGTVPGAVASWCMAPGAIAPEAAAVAAPVLVAMGERDVIGDPRGEVRAYQSSSSVDFYVCPRMGHMHNFAGTRELFWERIQAWAGWVQLHKQHR